MSIERAVVHFYFLPQRKNTYIAKKIIILGIIIHNDFTKIYNKK